MIQYELLVHLEVERMLVGGEKSKWGEEEIEKALLHLLYPTGWPPSGQGEQNQNATLSHTWDGHVNKAGFSVLHQPNIAIPLVRIGNS